MKEKIKELQKVWTIVYYLIFLLSMFYSILITKNYWEATLYLGMMAAFVMVEGLAAIKKSLDRIFYQLYLINKGKEDEE